MKNEELIEGFPRTATQNIEALQNLYNDCANSILERIMKKLINPINKCLHPDNPEKFYFRVIYRTFFYGPFDSEEEMIEAVITLEHLHPGWNEDPVIYIRGVSPLPDDYVFGFPSMGEDFFEKLKDARLSAAGLKKQYANTFGTGE